MGAKIQDATPPTNRFFFFFLVLLDFVRVTVVRPLTPVNSENAGWIQAKFYGKIPIRHISGLFFSFFFKILTFHIFMIFLWFSYRQQKFQNATPPPVFILSEPNFMISKVAISYGTLI